MGHLRIMHILINLLVKTHIGSDIFLSLVKTSMLLGFSVESLIHVDIISENTILLRVVQCHYNSNPWGFGVLGFWGFGFRV